MPFAFYFLGAALLVAGCSPAFHAHSDDHPALAEAPVAAHTVPAGALAPAPEAATPLALRGAEASESGHAPSHAGHGGSASGHEAGHGAHSASAQAAPAHAAPAHAAAVRASDRLRGALDAYLAVHDALASDDAAGAAMHGAHFARAFEAAGLSGEDAAVVRTRAAALAAADDLDGTREAFGHLSVPFARLVEAEGVPAGMTLDRVRCGMARDLPEQGVWLQRAGDIRNPYFGSAMLTCGRRTATLAAAP